jgi:hypothetical protein
MLRYRGERCWFEVAKSPSFTRILIFDIRYAYIRLICIAMYRWWYFSENHLNTNFIAINSLQKPSYLCTDFNSSWSQNLHNDQTCCFHNLQSKVTSWRIFLKYSRSVFSFFCKLWLKSLIYWPTNSKWQFPALDLTFLKVKIVSIETTITCFCTN